MTTRTVASTEAPAAPICLAVFTADGLAGGRIELTPEAAVQLAADLLALAAAKLFNPAAPAAQQRSTP